MITLGRTDEVSKGVGVGKKYFIQKFRKVLKRVRRHLNEIQ